jgi:hypothetical protein
MIVTWLTIRGAYYNTLISPFNRPNDALHREPPRDGDFLPDTRRKVIKDLLNQRCELAVALRRVAQR